MSALTLKPSHAFAISPLGTGCVVLTEDTGPWVVGSASARFVVARYEVSIRVFTASHFNTTIDRGPAVEPEKN